jgi:GDP-D-mannose dehydratase
MRFYHLARQSHVLVSTSLNAFGKLSGWEQYGLLETIARPKSRFVRASSSEMHGQAKEFPSTRLAAFTLGAPWTDGVNAKDTKSYYPTEVNLVIARRRDFGMRGKEVCNDRSLLGVLER